MTDVTVRNPLLDRGLPKWPATTIVVAGWDVTKEQAAEILIRTTDLTYFSTNDHAFARRLYEVMGLATDDHGWPDWRANEGKSEAIRATYGSLDLTYLHNDRIVSSWIGGPKGWCNWDGTIASANYNIGRWPSIAEVYDEWQTIAAAFPFLTLRSQLYNGETCEEGTEPVVEFDVSNGKVDLIEPTDPLPVRDTLMEGLQNLIHRGFGRERGCTLEQFQWALEVTRKRRQVLTGGQ